MWPICAARWTELAPSNSSTPFAGWALFCARRPRDETRVAAALTALAPGLLERGGGSGLVAGWLGGDGALGILAARKPFGLVSPAARGLPLRGHCFGHRQLFHRRSCPETSPGNGRSDAPFVGR